jgi:hypothetical protein
VSDSGNILAETATRIFADLADPQTINREGDGAWKAPLWHALAEAGLTLAWVPEALGGTGGALDDGFNIIGVAGRFAAPVALAEASAASGHGGSWSTKGVIVFAPTIFAPLLKISQDGGIASPAVKYASNGFPWFLPDGVHFLFASWRGSGRMTIRVGSLSSTDSAAIAEADSNAIYAGGRLLYLSGTSLMAQPFDLNSLRTSGEAEPIAEGVQRFLDLVSVGAFSASSSGLLAYQTGSASGRKQLSWFDRTGKPIETLGDPRAFFSIELSPDGRNLVASAPDTLGNYDLWLFDVAGGLPTRPDPARAGRTARPGLRIRTTPAPGRSRCRPPRSTVWPAPSLPAGRGWARSRRSFLGAERTSRGAAHSAFRSTSTTAECYSPPTAGSRGAAA